MEHQKITNINYRRFLDEGRIELLNEEQIVQAISNIKSFYPEEGKALLITLYFTGARPNEVLNIKAKDIKKIKYYLQVKIKGSKKGLPRTVLLPYRNDLVKQLYDYVSKMPNEIFLFFHYRNKYKRISKKKNGDIVIREEITGKLRYHIMKWFKPVIEGNITPYYLRHNRFSKLAEKGIDLQDLRMLKGSRTMESIMAYLHMSSKSAKKISSKMD